MYCRLEEGQRLLIAAVLAFLSIIQSILPYTPYGFVSDWFYQPSLSEAVNSIDPRTVGKQPVQPEAVYPW